MIARFPRLVRFALPLLTVFASVPALAQKDAAKASASTDAAAPRPAATRPPPWLYRGSDIAPDPAWLFGELPNGLRYAVRRNGVPPHQVAIRVAIDAGSLNESPAERGYAHFNEHLSFRGSRYVADGEAKRVWQRLGATFGSDTNASTTPTQTIYKLDLPAATPEGIEESVKILSGMMAGPLILPTAVDAERRTVLAELREGSGPQQRVGDATRALFFAGQKLGLGAPIGDIPSLQAATADSLRGFHDRWYRPARTLVVIAGDGDPEVFEALIRKYFADWKGVGPDPADPVFGDPRADAPRAAAIVEPGLPAVVNMAVMRPWRQKNDTIEYNRGKLVDTIALRVINRRLETRARAGGSFLQASVDQEDVSRSVDGTFVQILPIGDDWQAALRDVRGVIADAMVRAPTQDEIDREAGEFASALQIAVETDRTDAGAELADTLVEAVNIRETVASAEVARDVFSNMHDRLTPAAMLASTRKLMGGTPPRAIITLPLAKPGAQAQLAAAIAAPVRPGAATAAAHAVSFDQLPKFGTPATVVKRTPLPGAGMELVALSNGVNLILFPNNAEANKILISVRFGRGLEALPTDRKSVAWAAPIALVPSGIGPLGQDALDRLTSARRINIGFSTAEDAFMLQATTRAADLDDQLKLLAGKLAFPGWDPAPVNRARAAMLAGIDAAGASPAGVIGRDLSRLLHGGDPRWGSPSRADVAALTPKAFRALWEPLLASGPIEVSIYGDFETAKAIAAAAATFGALAPRPAAAVDARAATSPAVAPNASPLIERHRGPPDQAAAVLAWPTGGGPADLFESRKLDLLAAIFNDRMFDRLREGEGAAYSPNVSSNWPSALAGGGSFSVISQLRPENIDRFFALTRTIAGEFRDAPVSADELARAAGPLRELIARASSGNSFWLSQLGGASFDPRRFQALATMTADYARITPADLQAAAKRWLLPDKAFAMAVLPEGR